VATARGEKTRKRILAVAEELFATRGFNGTSVDLIARAAKVNKALIYYHFKNKDDLVRCLFESIIEEVATHAEAQSAPSIPDKKPVLQKEIQKEVEFLAGRKRIISIMLAEALRSNRHDDFLFRCAELVIRREHEQGARTKGGAARKRLSRSKMVHEFFTGFIPVVAFVALRDKWCRYFDYPPESATKDFIKAFADTHLESQMKHL
jgi:AcrR family transcriptional regulator